MTRLAVLMLILGVLSLIPACDAVEGGPASRSSRMREARAGLRVEWRRGEELLGKWRVERDRVRVYDAAQVYVGGVERRPLPDGRLGVLTLRAPDGQAREIVATDGRWVLPGVVVRAHADRLVLTDSTGAERGVITRGEAGLIWTPFEQGESLSAAAQGDEVVVRAGEVVALRVGARRVGPAEAIVQLIPALGALERAGLAWIIADWASAGR
jgi:hypothetical protein